MQPIPRKTAIAYQDLVRNLAQADPTYKNINDFLNVTQHICQIPARITVLVINPESSDGIDSASLEIKDYEGFTALEEHLASSNPDESCQIILVENMCPGTIALLGGHFDIDPQFFADHIDNTSWYRIMEVADHIPPLPSSKKDQDFLQSRYIEPRAFTDSPTFISLFNTAGQRADLEHQASYLPLGREPATVLPDVGTTRIPRKAGRIIPKSRRKKEFEPLLCTRQVVTVWFQKKMHNEGWTGVILLDPPFERPKSGNYLCPAEYKSFLPRPRLRDLPLDRMALEKTHTHNSIRQAFVYHLKHRLSSDPSLLQLAITDCFSILEDIYRLVASDWVVLNEYICREIFTVDYILENDSPLFVDLESFLKYLYIYRRRMLRYHELISEARNQCFERGQRSWPSDPTSTIAAERARGLVEDFKYLEAKAQCTIERIEKNINLLTALVAIGEGEHGLSENHGVARLTLLATFFLPFSTVAAILSMSDDFAPRGARFWIFWAVALPIIAFIFVFFNFERLLKHWKIGKFRAMGHGTGSFVKRRPAPIS